MSISEDSQIQTSDHSLLRNFRDGNCDAATELYLRYASRLLALARNQTSTRLSTRFDPEDVVQSVFRTFFRRVSSGLYDVPPGEQLWQLLLVLALNKVRAMAVHHRAKKRDATKTTGLEKVQFASMASDDTAMQVLNMVIDELMEDFPEVQQKMVQLRIEGNTIGQIAEKTDRSRRTVERVMQEFRQNLSELIDLNRSPNDDS